MRLRVPGPTPVPPRVLAALGRQVQYHRGSEFQSLLCQTQDLLRPLFGSAEATPLVLTASGTGGLEAALLNTLAPGDKVIVLDNGHWGARLGRLATTLGAVVQSVASPWGSGADVDALREALAAPGAEEVVAVLVAHNDTFTGAVSDLAGIGRLVRQTRALLIVDAVSSLGCMPVEMDGWGLDIVVSACQKGLMCPPGLALLAVSPKAWEHIALRSSPGEYWDLRRAHEMATKGQTPFTPAVNLVFALHEALVMVHEAGLPATYGRQARLGAALAAGAVALGLVPFADPEVLSPCVSVLAVPDSIDAVKLVEIMRDSYETLIAGARRSPLDGKVVRLGTMGYCQSDDIRLDVWQLARALRALGHDTDAAAGLSAVEDVLSAVAS